MDKHTLVILIFSSSILISTVIMTLNIDCDMFSSKLLSDKCYGDMNVNLIFVSVIMIPFIFGSAYYLFPTEKGSQSIDNVMGKEE